MLQMRLVSCTDFALCTRISNFGGVFAGKKFYLRFYATAEARGKKQNPLIPS